VVELACPDPALVLSDLTADDAADYYDLVQRSRAHLTAHGDYAELVAASPAAVQAELSKPPAGAYRFGIRYEGRLVGRADLIAVDPPRYGIGYWLGAGATGRGLATHACGRLIEYAGAELAATEIYAGVTHGNEPSVALLSRLGFEPVERFESYTRYRLVIGTARSSATR
jgi:RimJ/RimL family protein N-acetyltransferase